MALLVFYSFSYPTKLPSQPWCYLACSFGRHAKSQCWCRPHILFLWCWRILPGGSAKASSVLPCLVRSYHWTPASSWLEIVQEFAWAMIVMRRPCKVRQIQCWWPEWGWTLWCLGLGRYQCLCWSIFLLATKSLLKWGWFGRKPDHWKWIFNTLLGTSLKITTTRFARLGIWTLFWRPRIWLSSIIKK